MPALLWQIVQFTVTHSNDARNRQFEAYHRLIKELVKPEDGKTYVDRQCAAMFEFVPEMSLLLSLAKIRLEEVASFNETRTKHGHCKAAQLARRFKMLK